MSRPSKEGRLFFIYITMKPIKHTPHITTIGNFWTADTCDAFIRKSEAIGYEPAMVQTDRGQRRVESVRNNQRIIFTDKELADEIWTQLKEHITVQFGNSEAVGLNEMFRFYKYEPGQEFKRHRDQSYIRNEIEASFFTCMIYLNDDFEGGETTFSDLVIAPKKGMCLLFFHDLEHEGVKLSKGEKYVLRTDIMYRLKPSER